MTQAPLSLLINKYVLAPLELPWPLDLAEAFGREAELTLEIGFGNGAFLEQQAKKYPERNHLGVEVAWASVDLLLGRIERSDLKNVRVIRADARFVIDQLLNAGDVDRTWINHPDPWPKDRHHKHRLLQSAFLHALARVMRPEAPLTIATDHGDYAEWIRERLESQDDFRSRHSVTSLPEIPDHPPTKYQIKARAQGIPNHFFEWIRNDHEVAPPRNKERPDVPNVTLRGPTGDRDLLAGFEPTRLVELNEGVEVVIAMERAWKNLGADEWIVDTLVREGALNQQVGVLIQRGENDRVIVKTSPMGHPRGTWGVRRAVRRIAAILTARHSDLKVENSNVGDIND